MMRETAGSAPPGTLTNGTGKVEFDREAIYMKPADDDVPAGCLRCW
jgi:hypothetical protein